MWIADVTLKSINSSVQCQYRIRSVPVMVFWGRSKPLMTLLEFSGVTLELCSEQVSFIHHELKTDNMQESECVAPFYT